MIFGMPTLIEIKTLEETMKLCQKLRLDFIELNMNLPQYQVEALENVDYLLGLKDKYQINYTIHLDENLNVCDFNKVVANAYIDTVKKTIEVAKKLEAPVLNMHMNHGVHFTLPNAKVQLFEEYQDTYMNGWEHFRKICEDAIDNSDIRICIENTDGYRTYEKVAIDYLLESKAFALTWDVGHSNAVGNIDEEFIVSHESKLVHFHIHDSMKQNDHLTLGTGEIDLRKRLEMAAKLQCRCVIETKTVKALEESVAWLNGIGKE